MGQQICGYTPSHIIYESPTTRVCRTQPRPDRPSVVLKYLKLDASTPKEIVQFRHEFDIGRELDAPGCAKVYGFEATSGALVLLVEDIGGESLRSFMDQRRLSLRESLEIIKSVCDALGTLHRASLIHGNVNPSNIVYNAQTQQLQLIDFGVSTQTGKHYNTVTGPQQLDGTLAYMSPEQTGRMNRQLDYRCDLYSLGVTLYEMLSTKLPFEDTDPMELLHSHIARKPAAPIEHSPDLPPLISDIVMKLLEKNAEDRYQSARGLRIDIQRCLEALERDHRDQSTATIDFELAACDFPEQLRISQKLYGREQAIQALAEAFDRTSSGAVEALTVSGYSGIGKTSLVREVHKSLAHKRGYFVSGKYDQLHRQTPYSAISSALSELIRQILWESAERIAQWRARLIKVLTPNGAVLLDVVPELEMLTGPLQPAPALGPAEAQNRFNMVFRDFIRAFCHKGARQSLVLFLDDAQWADAASLALIESLMSDAQIGHLLLLIAYRDNEVSPAHPLLLTLGMIRDGGVAHMSEVVLGPLPPEQVTALIADTLHTDRQRVVELTECVLSKTDGNPFFVIQFLQSIHFAGLLEIEMSGLDNASGLDNSWLGDTPQWRWDLRAIRHMAITDNVIELMIHRLKGLPEHTQTLLTRAASIGNTFGLHILADVYEHSPGETFDALSPALLGGLVAPASPLEMEDPADLRSSLIMQRFRFAHDRIQQAAYSLIAEPERPQIRLRIARLLLHGTAAPESAENLFDIIGHFNECHALLTDPDERVMVATLSLAAGRRARAATAYAAAEAFLSMAKTLLPEDSFSSHYQLAYDIAVTLAECRYLMGHFERAETLFKAVLGRARTRLDKAHVYALRMRLYQVAGDYEGGLGLCIEAIELYGFVFPKEQERLAREIQDGIDWVQDYFAEHPIESLIDAPKLTDEDDRMIVDLLVGGLPCAYIGRPATFPWFQLKAIRYALQRGLTESSCFALSAYGFLSVTLFDDLDTAFRLSRVSLDLNRRFQDDSLYGTLLHLHGDHFNYWSHHITSSFEYVQRGFKACLQAGDLVYAGFIAFEIIWQHLERGDALADVMAISETYAAFARQTKNLPVLHTITMQQQLCKNLTGETFGPTSLSDHDVDEQTLLDAVTQASFGCGIVFFHIIKLILYYEAGQYQEAEQAAKAAMPYVGAAAAMPIEATFYFYRGMLAAALAAEQPDEASHRQLLDREIERFSSWAAHCPDNFENKHAMLSAERAWLDGDTIVALQQQERAIDSAHDNGFVWFEALAHIRAATQLERNALARLARLERDEALACYARWGALRKADELGAIMPSTGKRPQQHGSEAGNLASAGDIDAEAILRATRSISGEIVLPKLMSSLMKIIVNDAGAQRAVILFEDNGELFVEAVAADGEADLLLNLHEPMEMSAHVIPAIVSYVQRSGEVVVIDDASSDDRFPAQAIMPKSVMCLPVVKGAKRVALLYVENNLATHAFNRHHVRTLEALAAQAAIAIENAHMYDALAHEVAIRRATEEELIENQRLFQAVLDKSTATIYIKDLEGRFMLVNRLMSDGLGIPAESFIGKTDKDFFPISAAEYTKNDQIVMRTRRGHQFHEEVEIDGERRIMLSIKFPLFDRDHVVYGVCGISTDITEQRRLEEELLQARKLDAIGHLAGGVAHDFNNLLTSISGFAELLSMRLARGSTEAEWTSDIITAARRATELTRQLLDFSRKGRVQSVPVDVHDVIATAVRFLRRSLDKRIEVRLELAAESSMVVGDPAQLQNAFLNLGVNARDAMETTGTLTFATKTRHLTKADVGIEAIAPGHYIEISVSDTGVGIARELQERVFEPYYTTKPVGRGTGLGLAGVFGCVNSHHGRIAVESEPGQGTTFRICLPLSEDAVVPEPTPSDPQRGSGLILVIDDEPMVRSVAETLLTSLGYDVVQCEDGPAAISYVHDHPAAVDLALLDLNMPMLSGDATFAELRVLEPELNVIIATGFSGAEVADALLGAGARAILQKPFQLDELACTIAKHIRRPRSRANGG